MENLNNLNNDNSLDFLFNFMELLNFQDNYDNPYTSTDINCKFYDSTTLLQINPIKKSPCYLSLNVQSLNSKYELLKDFILELLSNDINIEIIAIQETWQIEILELVSIPGFHPFICNQRVGMRGGGVGFYIKENISFDIIPELSPFENKIVESITLLLSHPNNSKFYVTSLYKSNGRLPNITEAEQNTQFFEKFDNLLENLSQKQFKSFIFTDSNINLLNPDPLANQYLNSILANGFLQISTKATRIDGNSRTLLDHIITNSTSTEFTCGTIITDISDHFPTFVLNGKNQRHDEQQHKTSRIFSPLNLNNFKIQLSLLDWTNVTDCNDVDTAYDCFWNIYNDLYNTCFPIVRVKFNKNLHRRNNFMTIGLLNSRNTKLSLHKTCITNPTVLNIQNYKNYRNLFQKTLRASKKLHILERLRNSKNNPRETWKILNDVIGKSNQSQKIPTLMVNGQKLDSDLEIANAFNNFFVRIGKEISDNVPPTHINFEDYMPPLPNIVPLNLQNTTREHVIAITKQMAAKNSSDFDGVTSKMIKFVINEIATPLAHIFNRSLVSGLFPSKLKKSRVIPIFKSGQKSDCDNYRPISLLSSISKILEKIVAEKLLDHLTSNNILYEHQYGFTPGKSTEQNLIQITNYITAALNNNEFCIGVFIDLKKAFDVCSHQILLSKLSRMGINGISLQWFITYLSNRTQCVDINSTMSAEKHLLLSVIQGSILGPILFLCYINDLYRCTTLFTTLFADDGSCLARNNNLLTLTNYINSELQKIANWFIANKMSVNTAKTKFIIFRNPNKQINEDHAKLYFNSNIIGSPDNQNNIFPIERIHNNGATKNFKLLGILLDEHLTYQYHIDALCVKISKSLYIINRSKNFLPLTCLITLYYSLIHSHLSYCATIYGAATKTRLQKLFIKQKQAIRTINNSAFRANTGPIFQRLQILPLPDLITFSNLKFMHNFYFNNLPFSFREMWQTNRERNPNIRLRNVDDLYVPAHRYDSLKRLPFFNFPALWNNEAQYKYTPSKFQFQKQLKSRLLNSL
jgi:exonuclease III